MDDTRDRYRLWEWADEDAPRFGSVLSEPLAPENVIALPKLRPLHQVLVENLNSTRALLRRLEDGVCVPKDGQREIIRLLYVATRQQLKALIATLECEGLE
jgi:hypothetical protein